MRTLTTLDRQFVEYEVTAKDNTGALLPLGSDAVQFAFMQGDTKPAPGDWHTGSWVAAGVAAILVGPSGTVTLAAGTYSVWLQVTDSPEQLSHPVGILKIT